MLTLYTLSKPLVAAIHGHAIAGGFLLTLTADWRILREGAKVGLAEIRVGVPFPFGIAMILREAVPRASLEELALFGRNYDDRQALQAGLVHELAPSRRVRGSPACERLEELAASDPEAFAITKRYLRSATVERIRANDAQFAAEFLDSWFAPGDPAADPVRRRRSARQRVRRKARRGSVKGRPAVQPSPRRAEPYARRSSPA